VVRALLTAESVLIGLESTLYIEHNEREVLRIVDQAVRQLENQFGVVIDKPVPLIVKEAYVKMPALEVFLQQVIEQLKAVALLLSITIFDRQYTFHLRDYNYLGFDESQCLAVLKHLQDSVLYENRDSFYEVFIKSVDRLNVCEVKRWLIAMAVLERLGIAEGVSVVAQYLYLCSSFRS
jgi:hypothetical protein